VRDCDQEEVCVQLSEVVNVLDGRDPVWDGVAEGGLNEAVRVPVCDQDCDGVQLILVVREKVGERVKLQDSEPAIEALLEPEMDGDFWLRVCELGVQD